MVSEPGQNVRGGSLPEKSMYVSDRGHFYWVPIVMQPDISMPSTMQQVILFVCMTNYRPNNNISHMN